MGWGGGQSDRERRYDRPRALSRKFANSLGWPGRKGRSADRSMVLSVSASDLEEGGEARYPGGDPLASGGGGGEGAHTGMCSTASVSRRGAGGPAPAGGCPSACR